MKFIMNNKAVLVASVIAITLVIPTIALGAVDPAVIAPLGISPIGIDLYDKIAKGGSLAVLIKGGWDVLQAYLSSDFPKVKQTILYSAGVVAVLVLFPSFITLVENTAKKMM